MRASLALIGLVTSSALALTPSPAAGQSPGSPERTVAEGVFSAAQAGRGKTTFSGVCAECHTIGQFRGGAFQATWAGRTVRSFFDLLRTTMPIDEPGRLSAAEYAAVVAYILQVNGYRAGESGLPAESEALGRIRFEPRTDSLPGHARPAALRVRE